MSEIERKLASIQRVTALDPIEGADRIEVASVLGWKVVVQKGLYQINDLVVFFEIDSFLPIRPEYEFLRKSSYRVTKDLGEGFRVKTVKLRGQISQGLLMPLDEIGINFFYDLEEGTDLTNYLGVRKWEANAQTLLSGNAAGSFPSFIPKTDEPRVQNLGREKNEWNKDSFSVTLKYDGSSMTVYNKHDDDTGAVHVGVCSRNWELKDESDNIFWKMAHSIGLVSVLKKIPLNIAIQGELVGPGIQGNPYKYDKHHFIIFNIWNHALQGYLNTHEREFFIESLNVLYNLNLEGCAVLPYIVYGVVDEKEELDKIIVDMSKISGYDIEGVVFKSRENPERSYKYISPEYLLKDKE